MDIVPSEATENNQEIEDKFHSLFLNEFRRLLHNKTNNAFIDYTPLICEYHNITSIEKDTEFNVGKLKLSLCVGDYYVSDFITIEVAFKCTKSQKWEYNKKAIMAEHNISKFKMDVSKLSLSYVYNKNGKKVGHVRNTPLFNDIITDIISKNLAEMKWVKKN